MTRRIFKQALFAWLGAVIGLTPGMVLGWGDWPTFIGVPLMAVFMFLYGAVCGIQVATEEMQGEDE